MVVVYHILPLIPSSFTIYHHHHCKDLISLMCCNLSNGYTGAQAGIGVWFGDDHQHNISEPLLGDVQTNNRAELQVSMQCISNPICTNSEYRLQLDASRL